MALPFILLRCETGLEPRVLEYHIMRSNEGLRSWAIGLEVNRIGYYRSIREGYQRNPANWIIATDASCRGEGIPDATKADCGLKRPEVLGQCIIRYQPIESDNFFRGEIIDTTLLVKKFYQEDVSVSEAEKQSVYTHELGHCLGLRHTEEWLEEGEVEKAELVTYIMLSTTYGANVPNANELAAIRSVYGSEPALSPSGNDDGGRSYSGYFNQVAESKAVRHKSKPIFYIYPYDPVSVSLSFSLSGGEAKLGKKLEGEPETVIFYYYRNGDIKSGI